MEHVLQLVIGKARPAMPDKVLVKRKAAAERLMRGLLLACRLDAEYEVRHMEADHLRIVEMHVRLLQTVMQFDLFQVSTAVEIQDRGLTERLFAAGNEALRKFMATQRASLAEVGSWLADADTCSAVDMKIVSALQDFPGRLVRFIDPSGMFSLGHPGLRNTTIHASPAAITARVHMAGLRSAALAEVVATSAPVGLAFKPSARLVVPRDASDEAIDQLFECARRCRQIELMVYPAYSLIKREVGVLYLMTDKDRGRAR